MLKAVILNCTDENILKQGVANEMPEKLPHYVKIYEDEDREKINEHITKNLGWRPIKWDSEPEIIYPKVAALGGTESKYSIYFRPQDSFSSSFSLSCKDRECKDRECKDRECKDRECEDRERIGNIKGKKIISRIINPKFYITLSKIDETLDIENTPQRSKLFALCWALHFALEAKQPLIVYVDDYEIIKALSYVFSNSNYYKYKYFEMVRLISAILSHFSKNVPILDFHDDEAYIYLNGRLVVYLDASNHDVEIADMAAKMKTCSVSFATPKFLN